MTSREYFLRPEIPEVSLVFIDGVHQFEDALQDSQSVEDHAATDAVAALHDTVPLDQRTAARERVTRIIWSPYPTRDAVLSWLLRR